MNIRSSLIASGLVITILGCSPEDSSEKAPDKWFHESNINEADTLYMRDNTLKMITVSGTVNAVSVTDSNGNAAPEFHLQGGCSSGTEFIGAVYSAEAGGNVLLHANAETGRLTPMSANTLTNNPCIHGKSPHQIHQWEGRTFFEYSTNSGESTSWVEVVNENDNLSLKKTQDFSSQLEVLQILNGGWIFQLNRNTQYPDPYTYALKLTDFSGSVFFDEIVSLAFLVDIHDPKILVIKNDAFELLLLEENKWTSKAIASSTNLERLAESQFIPNSKTLALGENRTLVGISFYYYQKGETVELFEWVGDDLISQGVLNIGSVIDYQAFGNEVILIAREENESDFSLVSYNVDSKLKFEQPFDPEYDYATPNYFFNGDSLLYSQKVLNNDGLTLKSYDLKQVSNLDLGIQNSTTITIDSFLPENGYYSYPYSFNNFFHITR